MSRGLLREIDNEVSQIWGTELPWRFGEPIDADDATYTRDNIRNWLIRWHEFGQMASISFKWAQAIADVKLAVSELPESLRDVFELYYVLGYSPDDIVSVMEWQRAKSFTDAVSKIERIICKKLLDRRINPEAFCRLHIKPIPDCHDYHPPVGPKNAAM